MKLKHYIFVLLLAGMTGFGGGILSTHLLAKRSASLPTPLEVSAQQFNLVDKDGKVRARLSLATPSGQPGLIFKGESGKVQSVFGLSDTGEPILTMDGRNGSNTTINGSSIVIGKKSGDRIGMQVNENGDSFLALHDKNGNPRVELSLYPNGAPFMQFQEAGTRPTAILSEQDGLAGLTFFNNKGEVSSGYTNSEWIFFDQNGKNVGQFPSKQEK